MIARRGRRQWRLAWACVTTASCTTVIYPSPLPSVHLSWNRRTGMDAGPWCISQGGETEAQRKHMVGWRLPNMPMGEPRPGPRTPMGKREESVGTEDRLVMSVRGRQGPSWDVHATIPSLTPQMSHSSHGGKHVRGVERWTVLRRSWGRKLGRRREKMVPLIPLYMKTS